MDTTATSTGLIAEPPSDAALVRGLRRGDGAALDAFVRRHGDRLYRLALLWTGHRDDAADAVQEALLRGVTGLTAWRFARHPLAWLIGTLRNVCHESRRRRGRVEALEDDLPTALDDPARSLEAARDLGRLTRALDVLPERQRDALVLRRLEGLSVADTARIMGCREGTVKALLHQATRRLEQLTEEDEAR